jgi:hypothetical protein
MKSSTGIVPVLLFFRFFVDLVAACLPPPVRSDPVDERLQAALALRIEFLLERLPFGSSAVQRPELSQPIDQGVTRRV